MLSRIVVTTSTPCAHIERIAMEFDVPVTINPERRGIGSDWNFGLAQASSRFVTLAHQDDLYVPEFLARSLDLFARHPQISLTFTNYQEISDDGTPRSSKISFVKDTLLAVFAGRREIIQGGRGRMLLSFGNPISCSSVTIDREKLGSFRFSEELSSNLDWEAWLDLLEGGRAFAYCPLRLVERRYNDLTETRQAIRDGRRRAEDHRIFARLWPRPIARAMLAVYATGY